MSAVSVWNRFWFDEADSRVAARFRVFLAVFSGCMFAALVPWWPLPSLLGIAASVTLALGFQPQVSAAVIWFVSLALLVTRPILITAADELLRLFAFFAMFAPLGTRPHPVWPIRLLQINVASIYLVAALGKLSMGTSWLGAAALTDILALPEWSRLAAWTLSPTLLKAASVLTLAFECTLPIFIWWGRTRRVFAVAGILFHAGIALAMKNLTFFSLAMTVGLSLFLPARRQGTGESSRVRRLLAIAAVCAGCGRTSLPSAVEQPTPPPVLCGADPAAISWSQPQRLMDVQGLLDSVRTGGATVVFDPTLSEDGLTLFVTANLGTGYFAYSMRRPSLNEAFNQITLLPSDVNAPGVGPFNYQELASLNIATAFGGYPEPGYAAGTALIVLADTAGSPHNWRASAINAFRPGNGDSRLTADGRALIYASTTENDGSRGLFVSERPSLTDDFVTASATAGLTPGDNSAAWLSPDRLVLYFVHAANAATQETSDIWSASRLDPTAPFLNAAPVAQLNTSVFDGEPYIFERGGACELYFVSSNVADLLLYRSIGTL
jgi:hypothetical protein